MGVTNQVNGIHLTYQAIFEGLHDSSLLPANINRNLHEMTHNKRLFKFLIAVFILLLIPLISMQFSSEVNWTPMDFVVMGALLLGTVIFLEVVLRTVSKRDIRIALIAVILILFFLIWAELAVGIFGTPFAGS